MALAVLSAFGALSFGLFFLLTGVIGVGLATGQAKGPQDRVFFVLLGMFFLAVLPVHFSGWWTSSWSASCLVRDSIIEIVKAARTTDPSDSAAWERTVQVPALALRTTLDQLSIGWGPGLLGMSGSVLAVAAGWFTLAINDTFCDGYDTMVQATPGFSRHFCLACSAGFSTLALGLARDLATTSSRCDLLRSELNKADMEGWTTTERHAKVDFLYTTLGRLVRRNKQLDAQPTNRRTATTTNAYTSYLP